MRKLRKECRSHGIDFYAEDAPHQLMRARQFEQQRIERYSLIRKAMKDFKEKHNIKEEAKA
jgi:hypothetical protein